MAGETCTECGGPVRAADSGVVCEDCGLVREDGSGGIGDGRRLEAGRDAERRTGPALSVARHDRGLSTEVGHGSGSDVSGPRQRRLVRMRRQHDRARAASTAERNRRYAYLAIRRMASALSLPTSVRDRACSLFASAQSADLLAGRSLEGFAAAAVYATCRSRSITRTTDEVLAVARAERTELEAAYDALNRELGLAVEPADPTEFLPRYASELDVSAAVERRAREYAVGLTDAGRTAGKKPGGVAAACLYRAATERGHDLTQRAVADVAGVSRATVCSTIADLASLDSLD